MPHRRADVPVLALPMVISNGPVLDLVGQRPELLFNFGRRAAKI